MFLVFVLLVVGIISFHHYGWLYEFWYVIDIFCLTMLINRSGTCYFAKNKNAPNLYPTQPI